MKSNFLRFWVRQACSFMVLSLFSALLSGCSGIQAEVTADDQMNPDIDGTPSPVAVKVFYLNDLSAFNAASFWDLYRNPIKTLGGSLLGQKTIVVAPGEDDDVHLAPPKGTQYLGAIAAFREVDNSQWKQVLPLDDSVKSYLGQEVILTLGPSGVILARG